MVAAWYGRACEKEEGVEDGYARGQVLVVDAEEDGFRPLCRQCSTFISWRCAGCMTRLVCHIFRGDAVRGAVSSIPVAMPVD